MCVCNSISVEPDRESEFVCLQSSVFCALSFQDVPHLQISSACELVSVCVYSCESVSV